MFKLSKNRQGASLVLEILMIVVGINVALWFEGWFQELENVEKEAGYLVDLRADLVADIENLDEAIEAGTRKADRAAEIIEDWAHFAEAAAEEQARAIYVPSNYVFFTPSGFTFHSMQESGDFRLLRDTEIKRSLLALDRRYQSIELLQSNYLQAMDDGFIPIMMRGFDLATMQVTDPDIFDDQLFRNFFVYTMNDTRTMVAFYNDALKQARALLALLPEN